MHHLHIPPKDDFNPLEVMDFDTWIEQIREQRHALQENASKITDWLKTKKPSEILGLFEALGHLDGSLTLYQDAVQERYGEAATVIRRELDTIRPIIAEQK